MECATWIMAIATFLMVIAAFLSIEDAKKSAHGQFFFNILESYSSESMYDAINSLIEWKNENNIEIENDDTFFATWFTIIKENNPNEFKEIDKARRRVSHHFSNIYTYHRLKFLNLEEVKKLAVKEQIDKLLIKVVKPLDETISGNREEPVFKFFEDLYK